MNLQTQVFLSLAQNKPDQARTVIKGELVSRIVAGESIPDDFWWQLLSLNIELVKDLLPDTWKPSHAIWMQALDGVAKKDKKLTAYFQLLLDKYPETFCFGAICPSRLPLLQPFHINLSLPNIFCDAADISREHLSWLADHNADLFRQVVEETDFRHECHAKVIRDETLLRKVNNDLLLKWFHGGQLTKSIQSSVRFDIILPRVIPLISKPWHSTKILEQVLQNYTSESQEHHLITQLSKLYPVDYIDWFRICLLGVDRYGVRVDFYPKDSKLFNHCRLIAKSPELCKLIDAKLELEIFGHFDLRRHFDREKFAWPYLQSLCGDSPPDNSVFNSGQYKRTPAETKRMATQSALSSYLFSPDETKEELILKLINQRAATYGGFSSYSHTVPWRITEALLGKLAQSQKTDFLRLIIRSGNPHVLQYVLANEDISAFIAKADLPVSSASDETNWTHHLTRLHHNNIAVLLEHTKGSAAFPGIIALHPSPSLEVLAEAVMLRVTKFKTAHLSEEELAVLARMATLADKPAIKTIRTAQKRREKASLNK